MFAASIDFKVKFDSVTLVQAGQSRPLYGADVDERVWLSIIARDETKPLHGVEEFHCARSFLAGQLTLWSFAFLDRKHIANDLQIACRNFAAAINQRKLQLLPLGQAFKASALNRADVNEHIFAAIFTLYKAEALV